MFNFPSAELWDKFRDFLLERKITPPPPRKITCYVVIGLEAQSLNLYPKQETELLLGDARVAADKGQTVFFDKYEAEMIASYEQSFEPSKKFFVQEFIVYG